MKTLLLAGALFAFGMVWGFLNAFVLNLAGLPGALLAGKPGVRSKQRFIFGSLVSALGQSYVYLAYTAFLVSWTVRMANRDGVWGAALWIVCFIAAVPPAWTCLSEAQEEARELPHTHPQVKALHLTALIATAAFFVFINAPAVMRAGWWWAMY